MKKTLFGLTAILLTFAVATTSCKEDSDPEPDTNQMDPNDWQGDISDKVTLDAAKTYKLTGMIDVLEGGELTIPAGTLIEGVGGTSAAIVVHQGGKIFVNGTKDKPVVMTSGLAQKNRGDWGGLVICGSATCNSGGGMSEVGDVPYGGNIDDDNSGVIRYLRIEYSGAAFNSEKEYNGLSLFGVGSGTTIEYVQIYENADDGIEFYGGTVTADYIVSSHIEDDMFDWTEGWSGSGSNWYGKNDQGYGNRGMECDNWSKNFSATPVANPTISNVTLIGSGDQGDEPQGMMLRAGTAGSIDNVVVKNWKTGIEVRSDESIANIANSSLKVTNIKFVDVAAELVVKNSDNETVTGEEHTALYTVNENATGAGAGTAVPEWAKGWTVGLL
ncbi:MAG: hypothetical protein PHT92_10690 [Bacteroidales bacterium]|nr:hypothetical protein [Bacteroidales bacterium]